MTYKEFKEKGYSIELLEDATVYSDVTINESGGYNFNKIETEVGDPIIFRIVSKYFDTEHDFEEFYNMEEVEEYIKNEM